MAMPIGCLPPGTGRAGPDSADCWDETSGGLGGTFTACAVAVAETQTVAAKAMAAAAVGRNLWRIDLYRTELYRIELCRIDMRRIGFLP
ncbi:hypothetical protein ACH4OW_25635 [Streptomyces sp. NPDC017056]|uniref:hypothetical protein n=1 Tax=Streptomyces sp. NPDC017056 TaxID=3364973 RepID=UPI003796223B